MVVGGRVDCTCFFAQGGENTFHRTRMQMCHAAADVVLLPLLYLKEDPANRPRKCNKQEIAETIINDVCKNHFVLLLSQSGERQELRMIKLSNDKTRAARSLVPAQEISLPEHAECVKLRFRMARS